MVPDPDPIDTRPVEPRALTVAGIRENHSQEELLYVLTPVEYQVLKENVAEMLRWVRQAQWRLRYYRGEVDKTEMSE